MPTESRPKRLGAGAWVLALLVGVVGVFASLSGALTFIPYRGNDDLSLLNAEILTAISGVAFALSLALVISGWSLFRGNRWAWRSSSTLAVGIIIVVAAFAFAMPGSSPSPVPGGPGVWVLFSVVAGVCCLLLLLLYLSRPRISPERTGAVAG